MDFYIIGDMLKKGNARQRCDEAKAIRNIGYTVYNAVEQKDINDKNNLTEEENNKLAENIYGKDMDNLRHATHIVADVDNDSVGSTCEIGAIAEFNWFRNQLVNVMRQNGDLKTNLLLFLDEYPEKKVYFHTTDIRHTQLAERGMRRSFSINQFLHGACLSLNPEGIKTFDEVLNDIKEKEKPVPIIQPDIRKVNLSKKERYESITQPKINQIDFKGIYNCLKRINVDKCEIIIKDFVKNEIKLYFKMNEKSWEVYGNKNYSCPWWCADFTSYRVGRRLYNDRMMTMLLIRSNLTGSVFKVKVKYDNDSYSFLCAR